MDGRIVIADTQALTLAGLTKILSDIKPLHTIDHVANADQLFSTIGKDKAALLFIDYRFLPGFNEEGFDKLISSFPDLKSVVISSDTEHETILRVLDSGVSGFLTKECSEDEIKAAVKAVEKGEKFFCHRIFDIVVKRWPIKWKDTKPPILSDRELEVIKLIALGNSTVEIASALNLSHHTISSHRKNIIKKLNIKSPTEFVVHAIDLGLIKV